MTPPQPPDTLPGYFVVRARRLPGAALGEVSGVVERLGSGERREFRSSAELARVVAEWTE